MEVEVEVSLKFPSGLNSGLSIGFSGLKPATYRFSTTRISNLASDLVYLLRIGRNWHQLGSQSDFSDIFYQNFIFSRKSFCHGYF